MPTTTTTRIFNFSSGPAVLPVDVLEEAQEHLLALPGVGMSVLEISHRSKTFDDIIQGCEADTRTPHQSELRLDPNAAYVHMTSNNTIYGTEWRALPEVGGVPLVSDASSNIFSHPIDVRKHALIYAGAQKNLAPAGVTLVIIRD